MNSRERLAATLAGAPVDRIPFAFWRHFHEIDRDPAALADATVAFWRRYRPDFVKTMPNGCFAIEDWHAEIDFSVEPATVLAPVVKSPSDWRRIEPRTPRAGALGRELQSIRLLQKNLSGEVPILGTVFSPLTLAYKLAGSAVIHHLRSHPQEVHAGLQAIAETVRNYTAALLDLGIDGVYLASQMATAELVTTAEYREFGRRYDLQVLSAAGPGWLNSVHIHGRNILFDELCDYPVQVLNWHIGETPPTLAEAMARTGATFMGGMNRWDLHSGAQAKVERQVRAALAETGGRRLILAPGCVVRLGFHPANLDFVRSLIGVAAEGGHVA